MLVVVVVVALHLELGQNPHRILVGPVRELDDILSIRPYGASLCRADNDRPIDTGGLLHARLRVIPIRAALRLAEDTSEHKPLMRLSSAALRMKTHTIKILTTTQ